MIMLIDFDYFFAQVEEINDPSLKGKPVVVSVYSGRNERSGAVATSNYEARALGIKSGMPLYRALEIGKNRAVFLPIRKDFYQKYSDKIMDIISEYSEKMEIASIDEAYIDIDGNDCKIGIANEIKNRILNETGIKVSIGIGINKVIAKMAAEMAKPNGIKCISADETGEFLNNIKINDIPGIGKVLSKNLNEIGIEYLRDIKNFDVNKIKSILGESKTNYLYELYENKYFSPVEPRVKKNFGRYLTLPENTRDIDKIVPYLKKSIDAAYEKAPGIPQEISVVAIMEDLDIVSRSYTGNAIKRDDSINIALNLLNKIISEDNRNIRRIGVRLSKISKNNTLDDFF
ncbi:DNA polymerase IV [Picrophilus oshimae]|uniref:DNA polymerase IV n=1 Tax=Picrophilus torridus (strain ATCC 700027 / DSM 9790 / JCM 10055 / NBRC 100828 / KAW 2/3) TaxID=1122961 RepID=DPO4_PICTO|nr:DNA polymerase IV [Picrophilus oshimae]Q6KZW2.1 RecName: Full=DNA polymerase IV; Short=Pol IV [Picrophilus oshimae DSM 9789]AAT43740.1 DNA polymerase IV [Picrophilus oshimae DSM 9789]